MTDVEQKVVQMRFDDKDFDEKAQKTMKTLDKLANKLSFDEVAKRSDAAFKEVTENVEKIANQAYTIIDRVIDKIRNDIADKLVGYIKSATIDQVANGWQKYSDMTTAVGTLLSQGHKIEKVNKTLEDLSYFADETSYSFNDMLSGIGKFTAAGVKLDDAKVALMGISNWAAMSGQNAETASHVFGQLAQAMGSYMKKADWQSVVTANMDTQEFRQTALDTAVALGTLKKTAEGTYVSLKAATQKGAEAFTINNFAESLTQGAWLTSEVMVETYKKYAVAVEKIKEIYDETGGDVKTGTIIRERRKINKELIDEYKAMYNVTEETAREELDKWTTVSKATEEEIENYAKLNKMSKELAAKKLNATYYNAVEEYSKRTRKSMQETEKDMEHWSEYISEFSLKAFLNAQEARTFADVISSVKESASSAWREIYTAIFGDYNEAKSLWTDLAEGLINLFTDRLYKIADIFEAWKEADGRTTMLQGMYAFGHGIGDLIQTFRDAWDDLVTDGKSGVDVLLSISDRIKEAGIKFYFFIQKLKEENIIQDFAEALRNIKNFIDSVFGAFYDGVRDAVPTGQFFLGLLKDFVTVFKEITSNFKLSDAALDGLRRTFKGLTIILNSSKKTIVQVLVKIVLPILNAVFEILGQIVEVVLTITGTIGDIIEYFMPLNSESSSLVTILEILTNVIVTLVKIIGNGLVWVLKKLVPIIGVTIGSVASLVDAIKDLFSAKKIKMGGNTNLMRGFDGLKEKILEAWAPLKSFSEIIDQYKDGKGLINFLNLFTDITDGIGNRLLLTIDATVGFLEVLSESKFGKVLSYAVKALRLLIRSGLWLFNNLFLPMIREIVTELGMTIESLKYVIEKDGILGLLKVIQEVFKTGIFGELVSTINLINSVIGGNGIGKLMSKGAKTLESITSYFNAAKMNATADIMLKVIAALSMLYGLLALITFLPTERYDKMKEAMLDFGIALGIVVGGIFLISAAAALAGGNLIAMAAGFVGVAIAIATALWALQEMVDFINRVSVDTVKASLDKLTEVLGLYGKFMLKVIGPIALVAAKFNGDVGGIGIAMAGLAASIYILLAALENIDVVNVEQLDKLFEFLSGIYAVLAASTALMVLAARGQSVHGISIAIASVGVAFAAIKLIFPLCKDIIAEKDVFMEGQEALATFGIFMLAFAGSMWLVTSGVHGILSSIASLFLFRAFIAIVINNLLPAVETLIDSIVTIGLKLNNANFMDNHNWVALLVASVGLVGLIAFLCTQWRYIVGFWADMDTVAIVAVAASIIGTFAIITYGLLPAIKELNQMINTTDIENCLLMLGTLALIFSPIYAIIVGFTKIMDRYSDLFDELGDVKYSVNIGLVTRNYNPVASMFQSIMFTILGVMAFTTAILHLAKDINLNESKMKALRTILLGVAAIILVILIPMFMFFGGVLSQLDERMKGSKNVLNSSWGPGGVIKKTEDNISAIIKALAGVIGIVAVFVPAIVVAAAFLSKYIAESNSIDQFESIFTKITTMIAVVVGALAVLSLSLMSAFRGQNTELMSQIQNNAFYTSAAAAANQIGIVAFCIGLIFGAVGAVALIAGSYNKTEFEQFKETLGWATLILVAIMGSMYLFADKMNSTFQSHSFQYVSDGSNPIKMITPTINLLIGVIGVTSILLALGQSLIPALAKLQAMDLDKMTTAFTSTIILMFGSLAAMIASMAMDKKTGDLTVLGNIVSTIKTLAMAVVPMLALAGMMNYIADAFLKMSVMSKDQIEDVKWIFLLFTLIGGLFTAIGFLAGKDPTTMIGIGVVSAAFLAIGVAAYLIGRAAELLVDAYAKWNGVIYAQATMKQAADMAAHGYVQGMVDNYKNAYVAGRGLAESSQKGVIKENDSHSPSKAFMKLGKYCDQGLALGLKRNTKDVVKASRNLADMTQSVFADDLEIASPSKVFYKNGRFIVAGLQEGITSKKTSLADTMSDLGDTLANSIQSGFDGVDFNLFGEGKDFSDWIQEQTGNIDAGSIIGKMLGLDDEIIHQVTEDQLRNLRADDPLLNEEWFKSGNYQIVDKLDPNLNSGASKLGRKIGSFLTSGAILDAVKSGAEKLGITIGEDATSENVFTQIAENFLGPEDDRTGLGKIYDAIRGGKWTEIGTEVGGMFSEALTAAVDASGIGDKLHKVLRFVGLAEDNANDLFANVGEGGSQVLSGGRANLLAFDSDNAKDVKNQLMSVSDAAVEAYELIFEKNGSIGAFEFSQYFDVNKLLTGLNEDLGPRLAEFEKVFAQQLSAVAVKAYKDANGNIRYAMTYSAEQQILALMESWGIKSPSRVMRYIYNMVGEGAVVGIKDETPKISKAMQDQNSEEYRTMLLGLQAIDQLADPDALTIQPRLVPIIDTASMAAFTGITDAVSGVNGAKISASLDYSGSFSFLAAGQVAIVSAVDAMKRDLLNSLSLGELVKVDVNSTVDDNNLFDHFVSIDRQEYNRTGRHAW